MTLHFLERKVESSQLAIISLLYKTQNDTFFRFSFLFQLRKIEILNFQNRHLLKFHESSRMLNVVAASVTEIGVTRLCAGCHHSLYS